MFDGTIDGKEDGTSEGALVGEIGSVVLHTEINIARKIRSLYTIIFTRVGATTRTSDVIDFILLKSENHTQEQMYKQVQ